MKKALLVLTGSREGRESFIYTRAHLCNVFPADEDRKSGRISVDFLFRLVWAVFCEEKRHFDLYFVQISTDTTEMCPRGVSKIRMD